MEENRISVNDSEADFDWENYKQPGLEVADSQPEKMMEE